VLNSVVKIPLMFAHYFEYYGNILRGPFFRGHTVEVSRDCITVHHWVYPVPLSSTTVSNRCLLMPMTHASETGARKLASVSSASVIQSGAEFFWRQILESDRTCSIRDRIWRPRDQNTDLWLVSDRCCCCFRLLEL